MNTPKPFLKKQIQYNKKCYTIDPALIRVTGFRVSEDKGRLLESLVFFHLKMQRKEIYFHKGEKECAFLIREGNQVIQIVTSFTDKEIQQQEISGLVEAMSLYHLKERLILTENKQDVIKVNGFVITVIPLWKWLLSP